VCGESGDVCRASVAAWAAKLYSITDGYDPNTENGGEMGVIFHIVNQNPLFKRQEMCWLKTFRRKV
jgi:hypothetical protein